MRAKALTPILNVSDIQASFDWFEKLGWEKGWDWGDPPTFGGVCSGDCEIFLCLDGQGGRGVGANASTFGEAGGESADQGVREMHIRHPDGHVFRVSQGLVP